MLQQLYLSFGYHILSHEEAWKDQDRSIVSGFVAQCGCISVKLKCNGDRERPTVQRSILAKRLLGPSFGIRCCKNFWKEDNVGCLSTFHTLPKINLNSVSGSSRWSYMCQSRGKYAPEATRKILHVDLISILSDFKDGLDPFPSLSMKKCDHGAGLLRQPICTHPRSLMEEPFNSI